MVRNISVLLQAAHALAKEVAGLNDSSAGAPRLQLCMLWALLEIHAYLRLLLNLKEVGPACLRAVIEVLISTPTFLMAHMYALL
jgi:hypothetical protein